MSAAVFRGPFRALVAPRFTIYWLAQVVSVIAGRAYLVAFASPLLIDRFDPGLVVVASGLDIARSGLVAALWLKGLDRA